MEFLAEYFGSLNPANFLAALPGNIAQGIIWGLMGLDVYKRQEWDLCSV